MKKYLNIALLLINTSLYAQYAEDAADLVDSQYGFGAKSIAMGSAFISVADDYSAAYWNPAGLAQIKKMEFYGGISHLKYENSATYYGTNLSSDENFTKLSSIGMVFPVPTYRGSLVFALGYERTKDFDKTLHFSGYSPDSNDLFFTFNNDVDTLFFDKNLQQEELVTESGNLNNWSFAGAIDVSPNVSVGMTMNFITGSSNYLFDYYQDDINNFFPVVNDPYRDINFESYTISQKIISDFSAFQIKLGALLRQSKNLRIGLTIDLPYSMNIVEKYNWNDNLVIDGADDPLEGEPSEFEYDISIPFQFGLGVAYENSGFTASVAANYIDVSQVEFEMPDDVSLTPDYSALLDENKRINALYSEKLKLSVGLEYFWEDQNLVFRGGFLHDPSSLKDAPSDYDRNFYTGGIGLIIDKQFIVDAAYVYGNWKNFSSDSYTPNGTDEDITYQKIFLTTSFRF